MFEDISKTFFSGLQLIPSFPLLRPLKYQSVHTVYEFSKCLVCNQHYNPNPTRGLNLFSTVRKITMTVCIKKILPTCNWTPKSREKYRMKLVTIINKRINQPPSELCLQSWPLLSWSIWIYFTFNTFYFSAQQGEWHLVHTADWCQHQSFHISRRL